MQFLIFPGRLCCLFAKRWGRSTDPSVPTQREDEENPSKEKSRTGWIHCWLLIDHHWWINNNVPKTSPWNTREETLLIHPAKLYCLGSTTIKRRNKKIRHTITMRNSNLKTKLNTKKIKLVSFYRGKDILTKAN